MNPHFYVYIAHQCREEARKFNLVDQLERLKQRTEHDQDLNTLDIFEFPYYVKKYFAYNYRLLVHISDLQHHHQSYRILTFLKLYHRGDKDYKKLYINARETCDIIYKQRNIEEELAIFIEKINSNPNTPIEPSYILQDKLYLLSNYRIDLLNLNKNIIEYYIESPTWRYSIQPKLDDHQLESTYSQILSSIDQLNPVKLEFNNHHIKNNAPPQLNYQPFIYTSSICFNPLSSPMFLGHHNETHLPYQRKIPLEFILDQSLWKLSQKTDLPFQLNPFQQQCVQSILNKYTDYPVIIQGEANTGKTHLLSLFYIHFLFQETIDHALPCLFLCQSHEVEKIKQDIKYAVLLYQKWHSLHLNYNQTQLDQLLNQSCISLNDFLFNHLTEHDQQLFLKKKYIHELKFYELYQSYFHPKTDQEYNDMMLSWQVIYYFIKGYSIDHESDESIYSLLKSKQIAEEKFQFIYHKIWKSWYANLNQQGYWDDQDLICFIEEHDIYIHSYNALLCDSYQQLSHNTLKLLLNHHTWLKYGIKYPLEHIPILFSSRHLFSDALYHWQKELISLLQHKFLLNQFNPSTTYTITPTIIENKNTVAPTAISSLIDQYIKKSNYTDLSNHIATPIEIIFVPQKSPFLTPLLQQHHAKLFVLQPDQVINTSTDIDIFSHVSFSILNKIRSFSKLYPFEVKNDTLILSGFNPEIFKHLLLSYPLNESKIFYQLLLLERILSQGLIRIFILGSSEEFIVWNDFFNHPMINFRMVEHDDLEAYHQAHTIPLLNSNHLLDDDIQSVIQKKYSTPNIKNKIHYYQHQFDIKQWMLYTALDHYTQNKIADFFKTFYFEHAHQAMLEILWKVQDIQQLQQYHYQMKHDFIVDLKFLHLAQDSISSHWIKLFQSLVQQFIQRDPQSPTGLYLPLWKQIYQKISLSIQQYIYFNFNEFSILNKSIKQLIDHHQPYLLSLSAYLNYKLSDYTQAIYFWEYAFTQNELEHFPNEYYQAKLYLLSTIDQKIDYLLTINHLPLLTQELLNMNLNTLQAEYWQKILDYLYEEDELEPVLSNLLPAIHDQEILEKLYLFCKSIDPNIESFSKRIQRFKTLHACLNSQWDIVYERLEYYKPIKDDTELWKKFEKHVGYLSKKSSQTKNKLIQIQEELVDILYALNLNPELIIPDSIEATQHYQQNKHINQLFDLIRDNFTTHQEQEFWTTNFHAIRALCCLIERSPKLKDPLHLYSQLLIEKSPKDTLYSFFVERLLVILQRIKLFHSSDTDLMEIAHRTEVKFKKLLQQFHDIQDLSAYPPVLKQTSDIMKSILALSNQENAFIQKLKQEEAEKERLEAEKLAQQKAEQERLEAEKLAQQKAEQERLEAEKLAQQKAEQERLDAEKLAQQKAEQERLEAEKLAQQKAEQERLEAEKLAQQKVEQEHLEAEKLNQQNNLDHQSVLSKTHVSSNRYQTYTDTVRQATTEFTLFGLRIFISRLHHRLNIENLTTGERWSLHYTTGHIQSDWYYEQCDQTYILTNLRLTITVFDDVIQLHHLDHGVCTHIYR